jgi:hypothetical protein
MNNGGALCVAAGLRVTVLVFGVGLLAIAKRAKEHHVSNCIIADEEITNRK